MLLLNNTSFLEKRLFEISQRRYAIQLKLQWISESLLRSKVCSIIISFINNLQTGEFGIKKDVKTWPKQRKREE